MTGQEAGPFVVTHRRRPEPGPRGQMFREWEVLSQRAVATYGDAIGWIADRVPDADLTPRLMREVIRSIGNKGGRTSLPSGSEVEIKAVTWEKLADDLGLPEDWGDAGWSDERIVAAWNEKFASGSQAGGGAA